MGDLPSEMDEEFLPLPHFPYEERPSTTPLDIEEAATALYLNGGDTDAAAARLKCHPLRLQRLIDRSPRLQRLHRELASLMNNRVLRSIGLPLRTRTAVAVSGPPPSFPRRRSFNHILLLLGRTARPR